MAQKKINVAIFNVDVVKIFRIESVLQVREEKCFQLDTFFF